MSTSRMPLEGGEGGEEEEEDLIDFAVIEPQKENIQSLPSGRSAKALANLYSPRPLQPLEPQRSSQAAAAATASSSALLPLATPTPAPISDTSVSNTASGLPDALQQQIDSTRARFEQEVASISESDDPLDVYDRYVRWTVETFPSAQALTMTTTTTGGLWPLLERATSAFLGQDYEHYANDPRYLRIWLHYIRLQSSSSASSADAASASGAGSGAATRETFAFLARRGIGERLALYYEEFAAWLESRGRWAQAEEIYDLGLERKARPAERLARKRGEFRARWEVKKQQQNEGERDGGPSSPAIPPLRPALAPVVSTAVGAADEAERDPQQQAQQRQDGRSARAGKKGKLAVFSDEGSDAAGGSAAGVIVGTGEGSSGWESIGSLAERKKENTIAPRPWAGETLKSGKTNAGVGKMMVYKDETLMAIKLKEEHDERVQEQARQQQQSSRNREDDQEKKDAKGLQNMVKDKTHIRSVNPRTGRVERVFVNLEMVYPNPDDPMAEEYCFEELRARHRGWMGRNWEGERKERAQRKEQQQQREQQQQPYQEESFQPKQISTTTLVATKETVEPVQVLEQKGQGQGQDQAWLLAENMQTACKIEDHKMDKGVALGDIVTDINDENAPPSKEELEKAVLARKLRREERANRTRKIKVMETKGTTQTIQTNLDSPTGPKIRRRKSATGAAEPTMTVNTREAMDEIYGIFNQPMDASSTASDVGAESEFSDADEDDYTSAGDSTDTGRISATITEYDEGEEVGDDTRAELTEGTSTIGDVDDVTVGGVGDVDVSEDAGEDGDCEDSKSVSAWSDFTASKHVPRTGVSDMQKQHRHQDESAASVGFPIFTDAGNDTTNGQEILVTPTAEEPPSTVGLSLPGPPEGYIIPTRPYRDETQVAHSRLPFMTPIIEKTESSLGGVTSRGPGTNKTEYHNYASKTPSRMSQNPKTPTIPEAGPELWSSPFEDVTREDGFDGNEKVRQPALLQMAKESKVKALPLLPKSIGNWENDTLFSKGPIIPDLQCNPMDESIRATIIERANPSIRAYAGYFEYRDQEFGKEAEIRKYTKSLTKAKSGAVDDRTMTNLSHPPVIDLPGAKRHYTIKRELGKGAYAPVFLVESTRPDNEDSTTSLDDSDEQSSSSRSDEGHQQQQLGVIRQPLEAIKMENPPTAWEFYMLRQTHRRLGSSRAAESIIHAHEMHLFRDECYLILQHRNQGTLLDVVNLARSSPDAISGSGGGSSGNPGLDEPLALFFVAELLRTVEAMHARGIIHGDIKPDNVLIRLDALADIPWTAQYQRDGRGGWSAKGITLIDFGRAIDTGAFQPATTFVADWEAGLADCPEIRELRPWTYQIDYYGLAGVVHSLLFGKYMETTVVVDKGDDSSDGSGSGNGNGNGNGSSGSDGNDRRGLGISSAKTYRIRESLKRYWQTHLWADLLDLLLNPARHVAGEEKEKMPVLKGLARCRERIEDWLEMNCEKGVGLKALVRKLESAVKERRK